MSAVLAQMAPHSYTIDIIDTCLQYLWLYHYYVTPVVHYYSSEHFLPTPGGLDYGLTEGDALSVFSQ